MSCATNCLLCAGGYGHVVQVIPKPCGHAYGVTCGCNPPGYSWTSTDVKAFNGLCQCRGPLNPHPFHTGSPMSGGSIEYVGRHRKES